MVMCLWCAYEIWNAYKKFLLVYMFPTKCNPTLCKNSMKLAAGKKILSDAGPFLCIPEQTFQTKTVTYCSLIPLTWDINRTWHCYFTKYKMLDIWYLSYIPNITFLLVTSSLRFLACLTLCDLHFYEDTVKPSFAHPSTISWL